tara:strand:+ start:1194 stop:1787 length:594 start_codon:yes stop_codon:yes gene_type:complete
MNQTQKKKLARLKFLELREKEIVKKESLIYIQVENFLKNFLKLNPSQKDLYVCTYWPLKGEIDLRGLKDSFNIKFALPCCTNKKQLQYRIWSDNNLENDICGIPSPIHNELINPENISIIFVPALAIDLKGNRLGYGGGYFDCLRKDPLWRSIITPVVLPEGCVTKTALPLDSWDIPFNIWITEKGVTKIKNSPTIY